MQARKYYRKITDYFTQQRSTIRKELGKLVLQASTKSNNTIPMYTRVASINTTEEICCKIKTKQSKHKRHIYIIHTNKLTKLKRTKIGIFRCRYIIITHRD